MGIFSTIGKLAPTVGSIIGQLFSGVSSDGGEVGVVRYSFTGVNPGLNADFRNKDGRCFLYNMAMDENAVVSIDVPRKGSLDSQTIAVKSGYNFDMSGLFRDCAENNVDTFGLTACKLETDVQLEAVGVKTACVTISASGFKIPTDGKPYKVGSYLQVVIEKDHIIVGTVEALKLPIVSISSLIVQGSNDLKSSVFDLDGKGKIAVPVPVACTFKEGDSVDVDIMCKLGEAGKIIDDSLSHPCMSITSPEEMAMLRSATVLNR